MGLWILRTVAAFLVIGLSNGQYTPDPPRASDVDQASSSSSGYVGQIRQERRYWVDSRKGESNSRNEDRDFDRNSPRAVGFGFDHERRAEYEDASINAESLNNDLHGREGYQRKEGKGEDEPVPAAQYNAPVYTDVPGDVYGTEEFELGPDGEPLFDDEGFPLLADGKTPGKVYKYEAKYEAVYNLGDRPENEFQFDQGFRLPEDEGEYEEDRYLTGPVEEADYGAQGEFPGGVRPGGTAVVTVDRYTTLYNFDAEGNPIPKENEAERRPNVGKFTSTISIEAYKAEQEKRRKAAVLLERLRNLVAIPLKSPCVIRGHRHRDGTFARFVRTKGILTTLVERDNGERVAVALVPFNRGYVDDLPGNPFLPQVTRVVIVSGEYSGRQIPLLEVGTSSIADIHVSGDDFQSSELHIVDRDRKRNKYGHLVKRIGYYVIRDTLDGPILDYIDGIDEDAEGAHFEGEGEYQYEKHHHHHRRKYGHFHEDGPYGQGYYIAKDGAIEYIGGGKRPQIHIIDSNQGIQFLNENYNGQGFQFLRPSSLFVKPGGQVHIIETSSQGQDIHFLTKPDVQVVTNPSNKGPTVQVVEQVNTGPDIQVVTKPGNQGTYQVVEHLSSSGPDIQVITKPANQRPTVHFIEQLNTRPDIQLVRPGNQGGIQILQTVQGSNLQVVKPGIQIVKPPVQGQEIQLVKPGVQGSTVTVGQGGTGSGITVIESQPHSHHDHHANEGGWALDQSIYGQAGIDYPSYSTIPLTGFACEKIGRPGYYADMATRCQVFHICTADGTKNSFMCPNGTVFNQQTFVCEWWQNVDCANANAYYYLNNQIGQQNTVTQSTGTAVLSSGITVSDIPNNIGLTQITGGIDISQLQQQHGVINKPLHVHSPFCTHNRPKIFALLRRDE